MPKIDHDTKERILAAAEKVFHANGFKGARTSLIAQEAGISRTMMHYYFNSKEELFQEVLRKSLGVLLSYAKGVLDQPKDIQGLIENLVDLLCDIFAMKPGLPSFVVNILNESPEMAFFLANSQPDNLPKQLDVLLEAAKQRGEVKVNMTGEDIVMNIYGLCSVAYLGYNYVKSKEKRDDEAMRLFLQERKQKIKDWMFQSLKP